LLTYGKIHHENVGPVPEEQKSYYAARERRKFMKRWIVSSISVAFLALTILTAPSTAMAQQMGEDDGVFYLGAIVMSILHVPFKLVTCVGTQAGAAVAYTATYGVEGNYNGGTNGKEIGEVARRSCTGDWIITPQQVKKDYE